MGKPLIERKAYELWVVIAGGDKEPPRLLTALVRDELGAQA